MKRYPLEPLADFLGVKVESLARELGVSGSTWKEYRDRGVSEKVADRLAARAGVPAYTVWPELLEDAISESSVPCAECGELFVPHSKRHRFCSNNCRTRQGHRKQYQQDPEKRAQRSAYRKSYYQHSAEYEKRKERERYWSDPERFRQKSRDWRARKREGAA